MNAVTYNRIFHLCMKLWLPIIKYNQIYGHVYQGKDLLASSVNIQMEGQITGREG